MNICEYVYPFAILWMVIVKVGVSFEFTARCTAFNGYAPRPVLEILHTAGSSWTLPASEAPSIQIRMSQAQQNAVMKDVSEKIDSTTSVAKDEIPCPAFALPKSTRFLQASSDIELLNLHWPPLLSARCTYSKSEPWILR